jgi:hypothetical protein
MYEGESAVQAPLAERLGLAQRFVEAYESAALGAQLGGASTPQPQLLWRLEIKHYYETLGCERLVGELGALRYATDGVLLVDANAPYTPCSNAGMFKFKGRVEMNTVDFALRYDAALDCTHFAVIQQALSGLRASSVEYSDVYSAPGNVLADASLEPLAPGAPRIVECAPELRPSADDASDAELHWRVKLERRDKRTPNAAHVYESIVASICEALELQDIFNAVAH